MSEKKKIALLMIVLVILIVVILLVLFGGNEKDTPEKEIIEVPDTKIELHQEEEKNDKEDPLREPTKESESEVIELPFIPVD